MIDLIVACDKLAQFEDSEDIADFLRSQGVRGRRGEADMCVLAVWLKNETGENVVVNPNHISLTTEDPITGLLKYDHLFDNTDAMEVFIRRFDDREFGDLIESYYYDNDGDVLP